MQSTTILIPVFGFRSAAVIRRLPWPPAMDFEAVLVEQRGQILTVPLSPEREGTVIGLIQLGDVGEGPQERHVVVRAHAGGHRRLLPAVLMLPLVARLLLLLIAPLLPRGSRRLLYGINHSSLSDPLGRKTEAQN